MGSPSPIQLLGLVFFFSWATQGLDAWTFPSVAATAKNPMFAGHAPKTKHHNAEITLTYLEINGWLLSMNGVTLLMDPVLEGPLDFGIPDLYRAHKRVLPAHGLIESLPPLDGLLLTQGLDDHAHVRTLSKLRILDPHLPIVAPLSARAALKAAGFCHDDHTLRFLRHGEEHVLSSRSSNDTSCSIRVLATRGALVGPPWQERENGYILRGNHAPSLYVEPHVEFDPRELAALGPVDVVITPIVGQALPLFELVHGPKDALRLLEILKPKYLVPMSNGDIDADGLASRLVSEVGSPAEFRERLEASQLATEVVTVTPGIDVVLSFSCEA